MEFSIKWREGVPSGLRLHDPRVSQGRRKEFQKYGKQRRNIKHGVVVMKLCTSLYVARGVVHRKRFGDTFGTAEGFVLMSLISDGTSAWGL
jgi:sulfur relay (sulfurtransferase) complex TusBCD TusD component (DsrE family)